MFDIQQLFIVLLAIVAVIFLFVAVMALLRSYFLWLFGTGRVIEQNDEIIKLLKYIATGKQLPASDPSLHAQSKQP